MDQIVIEGNLNEKTGEIVQPEGDPDAVITALRTVGRAVPRRDLLRLKIQERLEEIEREDHGLSALRAELQEAEYVISSTEDFLGTIFRNESRIELNQKIQFTVGGVVATWPQPTETTRQAVSPAEVMKRAKKDPEWAAIAEKLGIEKVTSDPRSPSITVKATGR